MGILCRLLLDREVVIDHRLLHVIHDIISKVIDRIGGDGDEEVNCPFISRAQEAHTAHPSDDSYTSTHLSFRAGSRSAIATSSEFTILLLTTEPTSPPACSSLFLP